MTAASIAAHSHIRGFEAIRRESYARGAEVRATSAGGRAALGMGNTGDRCPCSYGQLVRLPTCIERVHRALARLLTIRFDKGGSKQSCHAGGDSTGYSIVTLIGTIEAIFGGFENPTAMGLRSSTSSPRSREPHRAVADLTRLQPRA